MKLDLYRRLARASSPGDIDGLRDELRERFGPLPDVKAMLDAGITLGLGSDNAMLQSLDVLEDARFLVAKGVPRDAMLDAAIAGGTRVATGKARRSWLRKGDDARLVVLPPTDVLAQAPNG